MGERHDQPAPPVTSPATSDCPLSQRQQTQNLVLYGVNVALVYLGAPVLYVGITQAALCERLGASKTVTNLPNTLYFWMTPLPVLVAWYFCAVRQLKPVLVAAYLAAAATGVVVTAALLHPVLLESLASPTNWIIPALLFQAAVLGCALGVIATYQWEVIGRGVSPLRRGQALALAFGVGPIFAFLSSLAAQQVLTRVAYPWNFANLFAATVPMMLLGAYLSTRFVVPLPAVEVARPPFVTGVLGGMEEYFGYRVILLAAIATVLVGSGYNIITNLAVFTKEAIGEAAEQYAGTQNALRFGFKIGAGLLLGWLLTRTHPKAGMLLTTSFCLASVLWALVVPGEWYLLSFGLMGAGELWGVYYPNYILCCSAKSRMRRNMAFTSMLYMLTGFSNLLFGALADRFSLRHSFVASLVILAGTLLFVQFLLPARPQPRASDMDAADLASPVATEQTVTAPA